MKLKNTLTIFILTLDLVSCSKASETSSVDPTKGSAGKKLSINTNMALYKAYSKIDTQSALQKRKAQKKYHTLHQSDARAKEVMKFVTSIENICIEIFDLTIKPSQKLCKLNDKTLFEAINAFDSKKRRFKKLSESNPSGKAAKSERKQLKDTCVALKMFTNLEEYQKQLKKSRR